MKSNFYFLFAFLLFNGGIFAQTTLQYSDIAFSPGDFLTLDTAQYVDVSAMEGPNMTWDLSSLTPLGFEYTVEVQNIANQPGVELFPNANLYLEMTAQDFGFGFFAQGTGTTINNIGAYLDTGFGEVVNHYSDPQSYWTAPLTYGSSGTDTFAGTSDAVGSVSNLSGTINWEVVGYGTLITGLETHSNVLMLRTIENISQELAGGFNEESVITSYQFLKAGKHAPVISFVNDVSTFFGETTVSNTATILVNQTVGINDLESNIASAIVYPNPASDQLMLTLQLDQAIEINVSVLDITGRAVVASSLQKGVPGENNIRIDLDQDVAAGTYFVHLVADGEQRVLKFQKQ